MSSYNRTILMGNLTRDVDLRYTPSGTAVTEIGLAVNDRRKDDSGNWVDDTTFIDVTLWGRTAEVASEYLEKGSPLFLEGRLKLDTWEKDGKKNYKLRVIGERIQLLSSRQGGQGQSSGRQETRQQQQPQQQPQSQQQPAQEFVASAASGNDDIPF